MGVSAARMVIGGREFAWGARTYVMGILNVTPDSFSGDGVAANAEALARRVDALIREGADIIDVGGESTRPGAPEVDADTELARVLPAIELLRRRAPDTPVSVDTCKARVAAHALAAGAHAVNDVSGLGRDPELAGVVAAAGVPLVLTHSRRARAVATPLGGQYRGVQYDDVAHDVAREGRALIARALRAGIARQALVFDPGFGFGKTPAHNVQLLRRLRVVRALGLPVLVGLSRKSFIGELTGKPPPARLAGSLAAAAAAVAHGADLVRAHDVAAARDALAVADAVFR